MAGRGRRRIAIGSIAAVALVGVGLAARSALGPSSNAGPAADAPSLDGQETATRQIDSDDGEIVIHVRVPDPILAAAPARIRIEIKNKLGQPVLTKALVLTISDDNGTKGLTAAPQKSPGQYEVTHAFSHRGVFVLRVFPPSIDSSFEIPLDVR